MIYDNGNLVLDEAEVRLLATFVMKEVDRQYPAIDFVRSMAEMKEEAEKHIIEIRSHRVKDKRDPLRIEIVRLLIDSIDKLTERGYEAAAIAGSSIRLQ